MVARLPASSALVLCPSLILQVEHAARRLVGSYHSPPKASGCMWSTVVAKRVQPGCRTWHWCWSRSSTCWRMRLQGPPYTCFFCLYGLAISAVSYNQVHIETTNQGRRRLIVLCSRRRFSHCRRITQGVLNMLQNQPYLYNYDNHNQRNFLTGRAALVVYA
jgi:hypothetical protein